MAANPTSLSGWKLTPASGSTQYYSISNASYFGSSPGTTSPNLNCNVPCAGNLLQTCGAFGFLEVYSDPTFPADTTPTSIGIPSNFLYFGCYSNAGSGPQFLDIKTPSTISCQNFCGQLGYAYSIRGTYDVDSSNNCGCGPEIPGGLQISESACNRFCNGTNGAAGSQLDQQLLYQALDDFVYIGVQLDKQLPNARWHSQPTPDASIQLAIVRWLSSDIWNNCLSDSNAGNKLLYNPDSDYFRRLSPYYHHHNFALDDHYNFSDHDHNHHHLQYQMDYDHYFSDYDHYNNDYYLSNNNHDHFPNNDNNHDHVTDNDDYNFAIHIIYHRMYIPSPIATPTIL
ncbi:MAG: hypothetical protein Q9208_006943 [Pyrenodesmia sp. 3 TL-2023]